MQNNPVKETCKALGITQKELAEVMSVSKPTIDRWSSTGDVPENAIEHLKLLKENNTLESELKEIKESLSIIGKYISS